jgi:hypothetical protein
MEGCLMSNWGKGLKIGCIVFAICDLGIHVHLSLLDQMLIAAALITAIFSPSSPASQPT